ncbi:DUF3600 domain-containing protein [Peribacillus sp. NPDC097206]|uniref:DUF3600 domain-containing protein n=1 Tax=unclassified Peribacillus TaxID=2675266 RepID=UPI00380275C8
MKNFQSQLRESLQEESTGLNAPPELKVKVINKLTTYRGKRKKHLVTGILIASLLLPTSAFAYQTYLADELYGSFDYLKKHVANATMEGYFLLDAKLSQAKGDLGKEEYVQFKENLQVLTAAKLEYGNSNGNIDYDTIPASKAEELKIILMDLQPYFDKLNGQVSSEELLSSEEYETYIEALMTYEKITVKSETDADVPTNAESLPSTLQADFQEALDFMDYVNEKQLNEQAF